MTHNLLEFQHSGGERQENWKSEASLGYMRLCLKGSGGLRRGERSERDRGREGEGERERTQFFQDA